MKKILSAILVAAMLLSTMGIAASAATVVSDADTLYAAVAKGGEVILSADIEYDQTLTVENDLEIDFNGYTITYVASSGYAVKNIGNLTLKDTSANPGGIVSVTNGSYALRSNAGNVVISDISIMGHLGCMNLRADNITINSGKFDSAGIPGMTGHTVFVSSTANVVINGGVFGTESGTRDSGATIVTMSNGASVVINDGTFDKNVGYNIDNWGGNILILGGTYEPVSSTNKGYPSSAIPDNVTTSADADGKTVIAKDETRPVAAMVNATSYETLSDAVAAANSGDTIKILEGTYSAADFINATNERVGCPDNLNIVGMGNVTFVLTDADISYNHPSAKQYHMGGGWNAPTLSSIKFRNINFELEAADTSDRVDEIYVYADTVVFTGCTFNDISVSPAGATKAAFEGCTFKNITNRSAVHFAKTAELKVSGNTFTECESGIHVVADAPTALTVTDNNFTGLADNSAALYFGLEGGDYSNVAMEVTGNTAEDQAFIKTLNTTLTLQQMNALSDETVNTFGTAVTANSKKFVATIDGIKAYTTLGEAIKVAVDGDTITLLADATLENAYINKNIVVDLAEKTLDIDAVANNETSAIQTWNAVTFKNGNINVTSEKRINNGIFYIGNKAAAVLTMENVKLTAENTNGTDVFVVCKPGTLNLVNCEMNTTGVSKLINGGDQGSVTITGSKVNVKDSERAMVNVKLDADDSEFTVKNLSDNAFRNVSGTLNNTDIDANGYASGLKNDKGLTLTVSGDSALTFTGATGEGEYDIYLKGDAALKITDEAVISAEKTKYETPENVDGNVISKADVIYVQFEKKDDDTVEREKDIYDIVLAGADAEKINELASADLTFVFDGTGAVEDGAMSYAITSADGVTLSQTGIKGQEDRFMFNFNGVTKHEETANKIVLGQVTINGYGSYTFGMKTAETNAVYATEIRNNIVDGFTAAAELVLNEDMDSTDALVGKIEAKIEVPVETLTINVTFPNAVNKNAAEYQKMTVKIEGGNIKKELALGDATYTETADVRFPATVTPGEGYVITADLPYNTTYTVTVSGAGYRTATYSVVLTDDKTLTFWNNVMDDMTAIEKGNANSETTKTFLAGDIVKDNKINVYDLSAVVSYFGKVDLTTIPNGADFAKYDLDRDGKIDAKDVAYVLVSWNE